MEIEGKRRGERGSALWGTGHRGGDGRSLLAFRHGRVVFFSLIAAIVLAFPVVASAGITKSAKHKPAPTWVSPSLLKRAAATPDQKVRVIITVDGDLAKTLKTVKGLGHVGRQFDLINGVSATLPAKFVVFLQHLPGLTVTVDTPVNVLSAPTSDSLWPYTTGVENLWGSDLLPAPQAPAIAVVDSGIDTTKTADFGDRIAANVNLSTLTGNSAGDGRGHGTFVASIAAGGAAGHAGASPTSKIVSLDVMDDQGMAYTSDVIAAADWILEHKGQYNIRVANFSLAAAAESSFQNDPLDKAVEKLWFDGVVVVAAAGNYGTGDTPSGVVNAPGNDPFVITVGAADQLGTVLPDDDVQAPWSAWGYTHDGFAKPELVAPGRYMVGAIPSYSTIAAEKPANLLPGGYMQISGTSFAAPVVAGAAAQILARNPGWTPDQVKGALMASAIPLPAAPALATGKGELNASAAAAFVNPPNPNAGLNQFLTADPDGGSTPVFDSMSWNETAQADMSWNEMSWNEMSWNEMSWNEMSWNEMSWNEMSWNEIANSEPGTGYLATDADKAAAELDPRLTLTR
jgi:serine protease AprX